MAKQVPSAPQADAVRWIGLCPCGCGAFRVALIDENDECIGTFGWDREGWVAFALGVVRQIDGESIGETICGHHTPH